MEIRIMCGIFTILNNDSRFHQDEITANFSKGVSRGPDNSVLHEELLQFILGFHRLSINGLDEISNQPIQIDNILLICNGEIYNHRELRESENITPTTNSDCEIIIHLYCKYGIEQCLRLLDGVFAFILVDLSTIVTPKIIIARDPFGVRPLYQITTPTTKGGLDDFCAFSSEAKTLSYFHQKLSKDYTLSHFSPGHYAIYNLDNRHENNSNNSNNSNNHWELTTMKRYHTTGFHSILNDVNPITKNLELVHNNIRYFLSNAVYKRCSNSDRSVGCLLSGGLDSSLVSALANDYCLKRGMKPIRTFAIGIKDSNDLLMARQVAKHIKSNHTEVIITEKDFVDNIENVIHAIESYDTTTVRASIGNYLVGKYIRENTDIKVVLNGDGSDELCGGYLYMHQAPSNMAFDHETHNLLDEIHAFDVLRSDKCISSHGLEPRTPFLDREWVQFYLSLPIHLRNHQNGLRMEKYLLRKSFEKSGLLPEHVLWRSKEAFSDGVSLQQRSLYEIIQEHVETIDFQYQETPHSFLPSTREQKYYKYLFDKYYPNCEGLIPRYWMPRFIDATDSSARTLSIYNKISNEVVTEHNEYDE